MNKIRVIEIGGTHIRRADIVNGEVGQIKRRRTAHILLGNVIKSLKEFAQAGWSQDIEALTILIAGPIDENIVVGMPNFPNFPDNIDLKKELNLDTPVFIYNDMTAAAVGMASLLNTSKPFWSITWSTGLNAKYWDGEKISIDRELGHELKINDLEAEALLGGRHMAGQADKKHVVILAQFLLKLDQLAPSDAFVFKGAIAESLIPIRNIQNIIKNAFTKDIQIVLSPEPQKDSFLGAWELTQKAF